MPSYYLYGFKIRSQWELPIHAADVDALGELEIVEGPDSLFSAALKETGGFKPEQRCRHSRLADGRDYIRWPGLFEFLVEPDGRRIFGRILPGTSWEAFQTYLLGQVLSYALLKQGIEPLHCTAVVVDGTAVGLIGDCGYGKSSLAAAFLRAGHSLLTDDLLVVKKVGPGFLVYPSFPRIKLFPEIARALLGDRFSGASMNPFTRKMIIPIPPELVWPKPAPLRVIFALRPPTSNANGHRITIRTLKQRRAFMDLITNTFNAVVTEPARLKRQFALAEKLADAVSIRSLSYPRDLARLDQVVAAVKKVVKKL